MCDLSVPSFFLSSVYIYIYIYIYIVCNVIPLEKCFFFKRIKSQNIIFEVES